MELKLHRIRGSFALKVCLCIALVMLGDILFFQHGLFAGGIGLFGLAMLAAVAAAVPAVTRQRSALAALVMAGIYAVAMIYSASFLAWLMFWIAAGTAILMPRAGRFDDAWRWTQRLLFHGTLALAGPVKDFIRWVRARGERRLQTGLLRRIVPVLVLPLIGTAIFAVLFSAANPVIEEWLSSVNPPRLDADTIPRMFFWAFLGWLAWGLLRPHLPSRVFAPFEGRGDLAIPGVSTASVLLSLACFNALFLIQNAMDAAWLWVGVSLPEQFTLAEYAHRGAYPLIATALLAALFVLIALRPGSSTAAMPLIRWLVGLWIVQNVFLVFNAALRTFNYVDAYSLTELRIAALLWMALVALGLVLVLWRMLADKSTVWLINTNMAALSLVLSAVCFVDLGAVASQWNVRHAREVDGDGAGIDLCYLNRMGGSALLSLIELEQRNLPAPMAERVHNVRVEVHSRLQWQVEHGGWDWRSQQRLEEAERRLGESERTPQASGAILCNGQPRADPTYPSLPDETAIDAAEDAVEPALTESGER